MNNLFKIVETVREKIIKLPVKDKTGVCVWVTIIS